MGIHRLFNPLVKRRTDREFLGPSDGLATGAFVTPQSLVTFPVASSLVTAIWKLSGALMPLTVGSIPMLLLIAFIVGLFIWAISVTDPALSLTRREQLISLGVAIINSLYLAIGALGINHTLPNPN